MKLVPGCWSLVVGFVATTLFALCQSVLNDPTGNAVRRGFAFQFGGTRGALTA